MEMLYNKHRPKTLDEVLGNEETVSSIRLMLINGMPHSILIHGPTGCGKTTLARIITSELVGDKNGNIDPFDLEEIDASDSVGVERIRKLRYELFFFRGFGGERRVYRFEEAHTLKRAEQEALLKPLEEPPEWAYLIFCTTDPDKIIPTIRNRCVEFKVQPLSWRKIVGLLHDVCGKEGKKIPMENLKIIAKKVNGSSRDALKELDIIINKDSDALRALVDAEKPNTDTLGDFILLTCTKLKGAKISFSDLYDAHVEWSKKNDHPTESKIAFSKSIESHGYKSEKHRTFSSRDGTKKQGKVIKDLKIK